MKQAYVGRRAASTGLLVASTRAVQLRSVVCTFLLQRLNASVLWRKALVWVLVHAQLDLERAPTVLSNANDCA